MTTWTDDEVGGTVWSDDEVAGTAAIITSSDRISFTASGSGASSRTAQAKMREIEISLLDFKNTDGSVPGTGSDDDTAIAAFFAAGVGKKMRVPAGTYIYASALTFPTTGELYGEGDVSIFKSKASGTHNLGTISGGNGLHVHGLKFDGNYTNKAPASGNSGLFLLAGTKNCLIENNTFTGFGNSAGSGNFITLEADEADSADISGNVIRNNRIIDSDGVGHFGIRMYTDWEINQAATDYVRFVRDNLIEGNIFQGLGWNAIEMAGPATVENRIVKNLSRALRGFSAFEADKGASRNVFIGNIVRDMTGAADGHTAGFFCQGIAGSGSFPDRYCEDNQFVGNKVATVPKTDGNHASGMYVHMARRTTVTDFQARAMSVSGGGIASGIHVGDLVDDLTINGGSISSSVDGVFMIGGGTQKRILVQGVSFNVTGSAYNGSNSATLREDVRIIGNSVNGGTTGIDLSNELFAVVALNNIQDTSSDGIDCGNPATSLVIGNSLRDCGGGSTGINGRSPGGMVFGNLLTGCTIATVAGRRGALFGNFRDVSDTTAPGLFRFSAIPTTGTWTTGDVIYNTSVGVGDPLGWICISGGTPGTWRPFGFIETVSADKGDASATLTVGTSDTTNVWATELTADRAVTLDTSAADLRNGAKFRIVRSAPGAFNLNVGTGPLKALAAGEWCDVQYNGSAWVLTAAGSL